MREIFGVHHMKFYVFDNDVLLTGANLSENYFTERQDRYMLIKNVPELANWLEDLYEILSNNSFQCQDDGEITFANYQPEPNKIKEFKKTFKHQFKMFLFDYKTKIDKVNSLYNSSKSLKIGIRI